MTVPTIAELDESLLLQPHHSCCDDARYLHPPMKGTDGKFVDVLLGGWLIIDACSEWVFDIGDGGYTPAIRFCPFCGEKLP